MRSALVIPALACTFSVQSERPLIFGLVLLSVVVFTIEVPDSFLGRHPRIVIPAAMWLWVNVHGTFSLGFLYLAVYLFGRYLDGHPPNRGRERDLVIGTAIAAVIIFVNPYGPGLVLFPLALMGRNEVLSNVREWQSVDVHTLIGFLYAIWVFVALVAFARSRPKRGELVTSIVFLFLGWWAVRNVAIAVAVTIPIVGRALRRARGRGDNDTAGTAPPLLAVLVCLVSLVLVGARRVATRLRPEDVPGQVAGRPRRRPSSRRPPAHHRRLGRLRDRQVLARAARVLRRPLRHVPDRDRRGLQQAAVDDARMAAGARQVPDQRRSCGPATAGSSRS